MSGYRGSTVPNQPAGAFWAVLNRLLIIFQVIVLVMSELSWPMSFFNRYFPILGDDFGLGALGVIQCLYVISTPAGPLPSHCSPKAISSLHSHRR